MKVMFGEMLDTTPKARRIYFDRLAALSPIERLRLAARSTVALWQLAEAGVRHAQPELSPEAVKVQVAIRFYGRDVVDRMLRLIASKAR